ncbi:MAG: hypothetical protein M0R03_02675 [Novosphingobium sp.]|nr:hypothetical protein [Novosphingobium sp.]
MMAIEQWLEATPVIVIGALTFLLMIAAAFSGSLARGRLKKVKSGDSQDGGDSRDAYVVSAVLGLLALLLGFTFSLAIDRFEARRTLVLQEANAIGTSYLYAQLLDEPHRSRMSGILRVYAENRVDLGKASSKAAGPLLVKNDRLLVELWSATAAAFDGVKATPFAAAVPQVVSEVIDLDTKRKAARHARVPNVVFVMLMIYVIVTAGMLGYVRAVSHRVVAVGFLFVLKVMSLMLILDIDRPDGGGIRESQEPLVTLRDTLRQQPPDSFDRWR